MGDNKLGFLTSTFWYIGGNPFVKLVKSFKPFSLFWGFKTFFLFKGGFFRKLFFAPPGPTGFLLKGVFFFSTREVWVLYLLWAPGGVPTLFLLRSS